MAVPIYELRITIWEVRALARGKRGALARQNFRERMGVGAFLGDLCGFSAVGE